MAEVDKVESRYRVTPEIKGTILAVSTISANGRTQVPKIVRTKIKAGRGDQVYWIESPDGRITMQKAVKIS